MNILVSDPISEKGIRILEDAGHKVDVNTGNDEEALCRLIRGYDALIVRSQSQVTESVIEAADALKIIGRAGVGVDNISIPAATRKGIVVVNSPEGNTIAAAEHTLAMMMSMARNIPQANHSLKYDHEWKRSKFTGVEVFKKTLGIIGLGKIGTEVARRAAGMGMFLVAFDPFAAQERAAKLGIKLLSLDELLKEADFITIHAPRTKETANLVSGPQFAMMKEGVRIVNCARGGIIDEVALADALQSGKVAGAAIDVFVSEPSVDSPLLMFDNVVATPHLGASTREAQINVALDIAEQIVQFFDDGTARAAVNLPAADASVMQATQPYINLAFKLGRMLFALSGAGIASLTASYAGEIRDLATEAVTRSLIAGFLEQVMPERINIVNALFIAEERDIRVTESRETLDGGYENLISVSISGPDRERSIAGTILSNGEEHIVDIDGYRVDVKTEGIMIITDHSDKPGIIGSVGTLIGNAGINIAGMQVGRKGHLGRAIMVLSVDSPVSDDVLRQLTTINGIDNCVMVEL